MLTPQVHCEHAHIGIVAGCDHPQGRAIGRESNDGHAQSEDFCLGVLTDGRNEPALSNAVQVFSTGEVI
jgi:hypothetical protein